MPRPKTLSRVHGQLLPIRLVQNAQMHLFEEVNHLNWCVDLQIVKLILKRQRQLKPVKVLKRGLTLLLDRPVLFIVE